MKTVKINMDIDFPIGDCCNEVVQYFLIKYQCKFLRRTNHGSNCSLFGAKLSQTDDYNHVDKCKECKKVIEEEIENEYR